MSFTKIINKYILRLFIIIKKIFFVLKIRQLFNKERAK